MPRWNQTTEERFWSKVKKTDNCWQWEGSAIKHGYGNFWFRRLIWRAHRVSWVLVNGEIPDDLCVLHKCDNRLCVRPDHLFLGTYLDNAIDRDNKGRGKPGPSKRGEENPSAKLTDNAVREILWRYKPGLARTLGREFGVSQMVVLSVVHRKTWQHVEIN